MLETTKAQRDRFVAARVTDGCSSADRFGGQLCRDVDTLEEALEDLLVGQPESDECETAADWAGRRCEDGGATKRWWCLLCRVRRARAVLGEE